jgi:glycine betaine/proline transport system substrate-binding protein
MGILNKKLAVGLFAAGAMLFAACGGSDSATETVTEDTTAAAAEATAGPACAGTETIKIARNNWTSSVIEVEIIKQLIETNLCNPVEIVDIDENAMIPGMSTGDIDANVEVWPSGFTAEEQAFIDDGSVVNMGELGAIGKIGWFVTPNALEQFPQLSTWEGLKDPAVAKAFATAATGSKGRMLAMDPSFSGYEEQLVKNLKLDFKVQYSGSEAATQAEIIALTEANKPVIMYYWMPSAAVGKYGLINIALPKATVDCAAEADKCDGDYPEDVLFKVASAKLEAKDANVFKFFKNYKMTTDDQLATLPAVEIDGRPAVEVAAEWIAANEAVWSAWFK